MQPQDADDDPGRDDLKGPKRCIDAAEELLLLLDAQLPGVARVRVRVRRTGDDAIVRHRPHCLAFSPLPAATPPASKAQAKAGLQRNAKKRVRERSVSEKKYNLEIEISL